MIYVSFTGHRPDKIGDYNEEAEIVIEVKKWLKEKIEKIIQTFKEVTFIAGGAQGVDQWAAEIVIEIKKNNKNVYLISAVPYKDFGNSWPLESKERLNKIISQSSKIVYVYNGYRKDIGNYGLELRNQYMVNISDIVLAIWNSSLGGTRNCFKYAQKRYKKIIRYNPISKETIKY